MDRHIAIVVALLVAAAVAVSRWNANAQTAPMNVTLEAASQRDLKGEELFEKRIRPLLTKYCQSCHGPKKQEAGLRLDSRDGLLGENDSGPIVIPGKPSESLMIEAVRYDSEPKMPPKGKLPEDAIAALVQWVQIGAPWPEGSKPILRDAVSFDELARSHWAFQPVSDPKVPEVEEPSWVKTPVDSFILGGLEKAKLTPSPPADRRTWIRRVTLDLHGLPPTPNEVEAFVADTSSDAFAKVVDRLLASPRYGERWGRYWLDVARYADTKGYVRLKENPRYPCSWTYRDYVIDAFNKDLPYDQFVLEQLAADQLELGDDPRPLAAMGFLTLGQRFLNSPHDIIDDRIDVVTRGLMGLTVTCARCHDHKFDPIPTQDYYSLHGVLASSMEPAVPTLILPASMRDQYADYLKELENRQQTFNQFLEDQQQRLAKAFRTRVADYLLAGQKEQVQANFLAVMFLIDSSKDLNPVMIQRWARFLEQTERIGHPLFTPWHTLAKARPEEYSALVAKLSQRSLGESSDAVNPIVLEALSNRPLEGVADLANCYTELFRSVTERWEQCLKQDPASKALPDPGWEEIRQFVFGVDSPLTVSKVDVQEFMFVDTTTQNQFHEQQRLVEDWVGSPEAAPHAMTLIDARNPTDSHVFVRGNSSNPGEVVRRQFLWVLSPEGRNPFQNGSGRLELAEAIASPDNPLTARVLVNRVWMHHFGEGLVRTPSDFGIRGSPPSHPELLDYLTGRFMEAGWSLKWLHRVILLSATYGQSSDAILASAKEIDPENQLLWKMNGRRLDWEALRDSLLAVSGQLDLTMGGPSVELLGAPFSKRRSVYGFIDRQNLPSALRTFDFVPPDATSPQRFKTTVPQQALFLMNHPWIKEVTQYLASRPDIQKLPSPSDRMDTVYQLLFARLPTPAERAIGLAYVDQTGSEKEPDVDQKYLSDWEEYIQALLLSNEFFFIN